MKYNENFIYLFIYTFFMNSPTGQTRRRIFTLDGSNDADSRKDVPFGGFVDIALYFGGEIPGQPQFWGVNSRFQAKRFHVIKTTASISTKFCTTIETIKWSSWVVPIRSTNPRWRTAAIMKKTILMRFGTVTHISLLQWIYL